MSGEQWKQVPNGRQGDQVSDQGRVVRGGELIDPKTARHGYLAVSVGGRTWFLHRLVLTVFVGASPPDKPETRHLDGDITNNRLSNLKWGDRAENMADKSAHGNDHHANRLACARRGHALAGANLNPSLTKSSGGLKRGCRACHRAYAHVCTARKRGRHYDRDVLADHFYAYFMDDGPRPTTSPELLSLAEVSPPDVPHPGTRQAAGTWTPCATWSLRFGWSEGDEVTPTTAHVRAREMGVDVSYDAMGLALRRSVKRGYYEKIAKGRYRRQAEMSLDGDLQAAC